MNLPTATNIATLAVAIARMELRIDANMAKGRSPMYVVEASCFGCQCALDDMIESLFSPE